MIDLNGLSALLEKAVPLEEEIFDVRFEEIVSLVDEERLSEASRLIGSVLKEGRIDLRLIVYLFYAQFVEEGIGALRAIFPIIRVILDEKWEKISPVKTRDKYLASSLSWFLSSIGKKIKRSEKLYKSKKADDFWSKSLHAIDLQTVNAFIADTKEFAAYLYKKTEEPAINQYVLFITKWLENLRGIVESEHPEVFEEKPNKTAEDIELQAPEIPAAAVTLESATKEILSPSEPMLLLCRKIQAFAKFIEEQKFEKAALVAEDISLIMKNFDPSLFFPKLFSKYFALAATHIGALAQEWENKNPLRWEAMQKLYQIDLDGFIEW